MWIRFIAIVSTQNLGHPILSHAWIYTRRGIKTKNAQVSFHATLKDPAQHEFKGLSIGHAEKGQFIQVVLMEHAEEKRHTYIWLDLRMTKHRPNRWLDIELWRSVTSCLIWPSASRNGSAHIVVLHKYKSIHVRNSKGGVNESGPSALGPEYRSSLSSCQRMVQCSFVKCTKCGNIMRYRPLVRTYRTLVAHRVRIHAPWAGVVSKTAFQPSWYINHTALT